MLAYPLDGCLFEIDDDRKYFFQEAGWTMAIHPFAWHPSLPELAKGRDFLQPYKGLR